MKLTQEELTKLKSMINTTSKVRLNHFKKVNPETPEGLICFAGDSMIEYLNLEKFLPGVDAINRGIAGATTEFILNHFDDIFGDLNPSEILISIGSNDLVLLEHKPNQIVEDIKRIFDKIIEKFPFTTIYYLSTTPVIKEDHPVYKKMYIGGRTNEENRLINEGVRKYTDSHSIMYIDLFAPLIDEHEYLKEEYTADGIHLNKVGYKVYADIIRETLRRKILCST